MRSVEELNRRLPVGVDCKIGIEDPKTVINVGNIIRAAGCFGASEVMYTGSRFDRAAQFSKSAAKHRPQVAMTNVGSLMEGCPPGYRKIAVELALGAQPLNEFKHPERAIYLFGPEDRSLTQAQLNACDDVVFIPAHNSLNLASAVNVVLYDRSVKLGQFVADDALIVSSRDNRNRLRWHR